MPKLIYDWKFQLRRLWTSKLMLIDMALMSANEWLPGLKGQIPNSLFIALTVATFAARFMRQAPAAPK